MFDYNFKLVLVAVAVATVGIAVTIVSGILLFRKVRPLLELQGTIFGGQRQRLLIARALALKPRILLFDEATSALDNRTQASVSESLDKMQVTRIAIAHRLSTIRNAHRIYVLQAGRVVQQGSFEELADESGLFAQLKWLSSQLGNASALLAGQAVTEWNSAS